MCECGDEHALGRPSVCSARTCEQRHVTPLLVVQPLPNHAAHDDAHAAADAKHGHHLQQECGGVKRIASLSRCSRVDGAALRCASKSPSTCTEGMGMQDEEFREGALVWRRAQRSPSAAPGSR